MIVCPCPNCKATLKAPENRVGARIKCPRCSSPVQVPGPSVRVPVVASVAVLPAEAQAARPPQPKRRGFPLWLLAIIIPVGVVALGCTGVIGFLLLGSKTHSPLADALQPGASPVASLKAQELYDAYAANEAAADQQYTNKALEIVESYSERLFKPEKNREGSYSVVLRGDVWFRHKSAPEPTVLVYFRGSETAKLARLGEVTKNDQLAIRGACLGLRTPILGERSVVVVTDATLTVVKPTQSGKLRITANRPWQDTGVDVAAGSKVIVAVSGNWRKGSSICTGLGFSANDDPQQQILRQLEREYYQVQNQTRPPTKRGPTREEIREREEKLRTLRERIKEETKLVQERLDRRPVRNAPLLSLIAKIGPDGTPAGFFQGASIERYFDVKPERSGRLSLQANDKDLEENDGSLEVEITVVAPLTQLLQARD